MVRRWGRPLAAWIGVGLLLALAGCHLQVSLVDPKNNQPSPPASSPGPKPANSSGIVQTGVITTPNGGYIPAPATAEPPMMQQGAVVHGSAMPVNRPLPTELQPTSLPPYRIEPPDILLIDTIRMIPKPPYVVQPLDVLLVRVAETLPNQPIEGTYTVTPDGAINLGYSYGLVRVAGLSLKDVEEAIRRQVGRVLREPQVAVGLAQFRGVQLARGEHLVRPDGTVSLGAYGCVYVAGLTIAEAKVAIERHLAQYVVDPEISIDVFAYNSKVYYVITDGAGYGQQVYRFPIVGKETVLDAISNIQGIPTVGSKKYIWVARPSPANNACVQILPVDWKAITQSGATGTNYQLFPGDRVYVRANPLISFDNYLAQILAPIERILGVTLLGATTVQTLSSGGGNNGFLVTGQ